MDPVGLFGLLLYTLGVFTFGALFALWTRSAFGWDERSGAPAVTGVDRVEGVFLFVCFTWFVLNLLHTFSAVGTGLDPRVLNIAIFAVAFLFPPLLFHFYTGATARVRDPASWRVAAFGPVVAPARPAGWTVTFWGLYLVAPAFGAAVLVAGLRLTAAPAGTVDPDGFEMRLLDTGGVLLGILMTIALAYGLVGFRRSATGQESPGDRTRRVGMRGILAGTIALMGVVILGNLGVIQFGRLLQTLVYATPLLACFSSVYLTDRFTFVDLFLKRGLSLLLTIVVLTVYFALVLPVLALTELAWAAPWVLALAVLPVTLALPWLYGRVGAWVDRVWLGRRFTTVEAVKRFLSSVRQATTEAQLVERAEAGLATIFRADARIDLSGVDRVAPDAPQEARVELALPGDPSPGLVRLGRRSGGAPFLSEDRLLLDSLVEVFAHLRENVRLHAKEQEQEQRARDLSLQASKSDLRALRAQINPHFLFNALNAIAGLIHKDPARADRTVEQLAEVFRHTLRRSQREWARLEDEFELVTAYLDVEQARFGSRLDCEISLDPAVTSAVVPTMMLQTLVENAVKHGVAAVRGVGRVVVIATRDEDDLLVQVTDNGPGLEQGDPPTSEGGGYGLRNVEERLEGYFGDGARLRLSRDEARALTVAEIRMPLSTELPPSADRPGSSRAATGAGA